MRRTLFAEHIYVLSSKIFIVLLLLSMSASCSDSENPPAEPPIHGSFGPVDQPIPPEGFLEELSPEERQAELRRIAEGTRLEDLPSDERALIEASNENDRRRVHVRESLAEMATANITRAGESAAKNTATPPSEVP